MQCPCGAETKSSSHEVKTANGIFSWLGNNTVKLLRVDKDECKACGRLEAKLYDAETNKLVGVKP